MTQPFTLSIETESGYAFQHGYHLGTIEETARVIAVEVFNGRIALDRPVVTVALKRAGKVFDVYDGTWASEYLGDYFAEEAE